MTDRPGLIPFFRFGLRTRLLSFFTLALTLPILLAGLLVVAEVRRSLLGASGREQSEIVRRIGDQTATLVDNAKNVMLTVAGQNRWDTNKRGDQRGALRELIENYPDLLEVTFFDPAGRGQWRVARRGQRPAFYRDAGRRTGREEFERAKKGQVYLGPVTWSKNVPQMLISVPLTQRKGVLLGRLSLEKLSTLVADAAAGRSDVIYMVDKDGRLLFPANREKAVKDAGAPARPSVRALMSRPASMADSLVTPGDGGEQLTVFQRVPGLDWAVVSEVPVRAVLEPVHKLGRRAAVGLAGLALMMLAAGLSMIRRILRPLEALQDGIQKIGAGQLSHRLEIRTGDEIQRVSEEVNAMARSLENVEEVKRDLIHMIVHDLKSPLSSVLGSVDYVLAMDRGTLTPEQKKLLSLGGKSGRDLLRLIQNILDMAKMEEGRLELRREWFSLAELAGECMDDLEALILRENKVISVEIPKDMPKAWADRDLVKRVLANLLSNALRHTPPQTEISLRVREEKTPAILIVSVKDDGDGIPAHFRERIFDKFSQADGKKQNIRVGSGLGLAFCKLAVEAHGGAITVESLVGEGSEFMFSLPRVAPPAPSPAPVPPEKIAVS